MSQVCHQQGTTQRWVCNCKVFFWEGYYWSCKHRIILRAVLIRIWNDGVEESIWIFTGIYSEERMCRTARAQILIIWGKSFHFWEYGNSTYEHQGIWCNTVTSFHLAKKFPSLLTSAVLFFMCVLFLLKVLVHWIFVNQSKGQILGRSETIYSNKHCV